MFLWRVVWVIRLRTIIPFYLISFLRPYGLFCKYGSPESYVRMFAFLLPYVRAFTSVCSRIYIRMYKRLNTDSETERYASLFKYLNINILAVKKTKNRALQFTITERLNYPTREKKLYASNWKYGTTDLKNKRKIILNVVKVICSV